MLIKEGPVSKEGEYIELMTSDIFPFLESFLIRGFVPCCEELELLDFCLIDLIASNNQKHVK